MIYAKDQRSTNLAAIFDRLNTSESGLTGVEAGRRANEYRQEADLAQRLAVTAKVLGRKALEEISKVFTPDTLLRWHKRLVAEKWDHSDKRVLPGRPATPHEVVELILRFARENPTWGFDRIADALANIGHNISDQTVGNVLKANDIEPAPQRKRTTTRSTFLKAHWNNWPRSTSRRWRYGRPMAWSPISCSLPCVWPRVRCSSGFALRILRAYG